jgi:mannose-6-phosphate isomerase-like protein (cupin superfamily)
MRLIGIVFLLIGLSLCAFAQTRQPSTSTKPFSIKSKQDLDSIAKELKLEQGNKTRDIVPEKGMQTRVAVFHDEKRENDLYELHDASDDIYYVLDGKATLAIGGMLVNATEKSPGEWRSSTASGTKLFDVKKGDLIMIPRGTVHQRTVTGNGFSMILIKVFAAEQP